MRPIRIYFVFFLLVILDSRVIFRLPKTLRILFCSLWVWMLRFLGVLRFTRYFFLQIHKICTTDSWQYWNLSFSTFLYSREKFPVYARDSFLYLAYWIWALTLLSFMLGWYIFYYLYTTLYCPLYEWIFFFPVSGFFLQWLIVRTQKGSCPIKCDISPILFD